MTMKRVENMNRIPAKYWTLFYTLMLTFAIATISCQTESEDKIQLPEQDIKTVMEAHAARLMAISGVTAVAIGELQDKTPCIKIYILDESEEIKNSIPSSLDGHPVVITVSGQIKPMSGDSL